MIPVLGNAKGGDIMDSILNNVKKLLGIDSEDDSFDVESCIINPQHQPWPKWV